MTEASDPAGLDQPLPSVRGAMLAARQVRKLQIISMAGVTMAQQIAKQAEDANYLGAEGALMFARVARTVRQTVAMERSLGAHAAEPSDAQLNKLAHGLRYRHNARRSDAPADRRAQLVRRA